MGEKVLKLQERLSFQPIDTAGNQATSTLGTECESLRPPPDAYLLRRETGSQPTIAPIRTYDSTEIPFGLHDLEKGLCNWHSQPAHEISYSHSRVTYTDPEDDSDEDGPKEHAIWILVGHLIPDKRFTALTFTKPIDLPLRPVAPSCSTSSTLHPPHGYATSAVPSTVLMLEKMARLRTLL